MIYRFHDCELDLGAHELRRGGTPVRVEPQVFDLLAHLVRHHGRMVSRDELFEEVWRGRLVSDATLSSRIKAARRAVGDTGKDQRIIQTLPRRGFRFVAKLQVEPITEAVAADARDHDVGPLQLPDKPSIAVLPFDNMSADPEQEYFADGITEDIITGLSNIRSYTVLARSSTFVYKGTSVDAKDIGRRLNVHYVLEGSVRRAGNRVRVTAQLIDAVAGDQIWANRYDGTLEDIFELQDRITSTIVGTIEPELVRAEGSRLREKRPDNMAAYDYLLRGLALMYKLTTEDTRAALACFEKSIELDPKYGRAYAYASWCYRRDVQQSGLTLSVEDRLKAIKLARESLRLDRDDPFVLAYAAAAIGFLERDFGEALALADRAITLNPLSHRFWNLRATLRSFQGETDAAIEAAERAINLSPNNPAIWVAYLAIAESHLQEMRYEEAIEGAKQALRHNEILAPAHHVIAASAAHLGRDADAQQALTGALTINPDLTVSNLQHLYPVTRFKNLNAFLDGLRKAGLPE